MIYDIFKVVPVSWNNIQASEVLKMHVSTKINVKGGGGGGGGAEGQSDKMVSDINKHRKQRCLNEFLHVE